jgi:hypothetical protein
MGDCYSATLYVKVAKGSKKNLAAIMRQWMREEAKSTDGHLGVDWNLAEYRRHGIRPDSFSGICKILLAFHQGNARHLTDEDGFDLYRSGFNASYGWNRVMVGAFFKMAWALEEGSYLEIDRDEGHDIYEVKHDGDDAEVWENHRPPYHMR